MSFAFTPVVASGSTTSPPLGSAANVPICALDFVLVVNAGHLRGDP